MRTLWEETRELNLSTSGQVDRLDAPPSPLRFLRDYVSTNKPCLISRDATRSRPTVSLWSDDAYLCCALRDRAVSLHLTPHGRADSLVPNPSANGRGGGLCFTSAVVHSMDFSEALSLITNTSSLSLPTVAYA